MSQEHCAKASPTPLIFSTVDSVHYAGLIESVSVRTSGRSAPFGRWVSSGGRLTIHNHYIFFVLAKLALCVTVILSPLEIGFQRSTRRVGRRTRCLPFKPQYYLPGKSEFFSEDFHQNFTPFSFIAVSTERSPLQLAGKRTQFPPNSEGFVPNFTTSNFVSTKFAHTYPPGCTCTYFVRGSAHNPSYVCF